MAALDFVRLSAKPGTGETTQTRRSNPLLKKSRGGGCDFMAAGYPFAAYRIYSNV